MQDDEPLPLYQVLEEEFVSLHKPLPEDHYKKDGGDESRLNNLYTEIHKLDKPRSAFCISGGGIRSATFALGVIQGLARYHILDKFDYLSTVSGGGYIGSWLSSWIHRNPGGTAGVFQRLRSAPTSPLNPEPKPIQHLRTFSNYLSPQLGLLSADSWTLAATILRNLLLNWLVLLPLLAAVLALPRLCIAVIQWDGSAASTPSGFLWAGSAAIVMAIVYVGLSLPSTSNFAPRFGPPPFARTQGGFLFLCFAPLWLGGILLSIYWAWRVRLNLSVPEPSDFAWYGVKVCAIGGAIYTLWLLITDWQRWLRHLGYFLCVVICGGLGGLLLWVLAVKIFSHPVSNLTPVCLTDWHCLLPTDLYVCFALPAFLLLFLLGATVFVGVASMFSTDDDREWFARMGAWVLILILGWSAFSALAIFGPLLLLMSSATIKAISAVVGAVSGYITILFGRSSKTAANSEKAAKNGNQSFGRSLALALAAPIFALFIVILLSYGTSWLLILLTRLVPYLISFLHSFFPNGKSAWSYANFPDTLTSTIQHLQIIHLSGLKLVALLIGLLLVVSFGMAFAINVNKFSLHSMYRNRLIKAYLGASRAKRRPNPFTGFDHDDNLQMYQLSPEQFYAGSFRRANPSNEESPLLLMQGLKAAAEGRPPTSNYEALYNQLGTEAQNEIKEYDPPEKTLTIQVLNGLNRLLNEQDFGFLTLPDSAPAPKTHQPARGHKAAPARESLFSRRLRSRLRFEAAFPDEITPFRQRKPLHVVNMALNLVHGDNLAWQERMADSFTATGLHTGNCQVGYRPSVWYGGKEAISLGTAVAISGAAVSPNMGYHSSPVITFLLTLFNARLGWWLGNPRKGAYRNGSPSFTIGPLLAETFGLTNSNRRYVYLSDGGHFENLGLYEMVRRRCHFIVVVDAGCDEQCGFEDLGNAVRKIRIDMGIPIEFNMPIKIHPRSARKKAGQYCALACIDYKRVDGGTAKNGILVYIKPAFYGNESRDIYNYAKTHESFPHETTADQFFSESQFESYRALGYHVVTQLCDTQPSTTPPDLNLDDFVSRVAAYICRKPSSDPVIQDCLRDIVEDACRQMSNPDDTESSSRPPDSEDLLST